MNGLSPKIDLSWESEFQDLLRKCWSLNPDDRPVMREVRAILGNLEKQFITNNKKRTPGLQN